MTKLKQSLLLGVIAIFVILLSLFSFGNIHTSVINKSVQSSKSLDIAKSQLIVLQSNLNQLKSSVTYSPSFYRDSSEIITQTLSNGLLTLDTSFEYFISVQGLDSSQTKLLVNFLNVTSQSMDWDSLGIFFEPFVDGSDGKFISGADKKWIGKIPPGEKYLKEIEKVVKDLKDPSTGRIDDSSNIEFFTYRRYHVINNGDMGMRFALGYYDLEYDVIVGIAAPQSAYSEVIQRTYNMSKIALTLFTILSFALIGFLMHLMSKLREEREKLLSSNKHLTKYKEALDDSHSGVAILGEDTKIEYSNKKFTELYGKYVNVGDNLNEKSRYPNFNEAFLESLTKGVGHYTNKGVVHSKVSLNRFKTNDELKVILISQDITELQELNDKLNVMNSDLEKSNEELTKVNQELKDFTEKQKILIGAISHDIITPLYSPLSVARNLVERFGNNMEFKAELKNLLNGVGNAIKIVTNYRDSARLNLNLPKESKQLLDLNEPIEFAKNTLSPLDKLNDISINLNLGKKLIINGDKINFESIFRNLFINGINAILQKKEFGSVKDFSGEISVTKELKENAIILRIKDNGIGMSKEQTKMLFNPTDINLGLGSYIVANFVKLNNKDNKIKVTSEEGEGTEIEITLKTN